MKFYAVKCSPIRNENSFQELRIIYSLTPHDNLMTFKDVYITPEKEIALVMDVADNGTLGEYAFELKSNDQLSELQILFWLE